MDIVIAESPPREGVSRRVFYGWWVLGAGSVIMGVGSGVSGYAATIFFVPVATALGLSHAATSLATSIARLENSLFAFVVGYIIDRFGPRPAIAFGMSLMGIGLICFGLFADSLVSLIITWSFMVALGGSIGAFPPVWAALNNWFVRGKGRAMGIGMAAQSLGGLLIAPALALLIALTDWRTAAIVTGVVVLAVTVPLSRVMVARPADMGLQPDGDPPRPRADVPSRDLDAILAAQRTVTNFTLREALRTPALWILNFSFGIRQMVAGGVTLHLSPMLQAGGLSSVHAGTMVGVMALMGIVGAMVIGHLADRYERRKVAGAAVGIEAAALFILFFGDTGWTLYLFLAGYGFSIGVHTLNRVMLGDYWGQSHYARLWGLLSMGTTPLAVVGPVLAGWVFDTYQSYAPVILLFAVLCTASAIGYYNCRRPAAPMAR